MDTAIEWIDDYREEADHKIRTLADHGIPGLRTLGWLKKTGVHESPPEHFHKDAYEIVFVLSGKLQLCCDGVQFPLVGGDVFLMPPNVAHGTNTIPYTPCEMIWMQISSVNPSGLFHLSDAAGQDLLDHLKEIPGHLLHTDSKKIRELLLQVKQLLCGSHGKVNSYEAANRIAALLYQLLHFSEKSKQQVSDEMELVCQYIEANLTEDIALADLAAVAGLSLSWFKHRFSREIGVTPANYILRLKIKAIQDELTEGCNLAKLAAKYGFSSHSHLTAVFRKYVGMTPTGYLKLHPRSAVQRIS